MNTQRNLQAAHEIGDLATVALLKVITVSIEKNLWFLESYLEGITVGLHGRKLPPLELRRSMIKARRIGARAPRHPERHNRSATAAADCWARLVLDSRISCYDPFIDF